MLECPLCSASPLHLAFKIASFDLTTKIPNFLLNINLGPSLLNVTI
jgi:hypothetical protein